MNILNKNWESGFGSVFTWFAQDKNGKISVMINNGFGYFPKALLNIDNGNEILIDLNEYNICGKNQKNLLEYSIIKMVLLF